MSHKEQLVQLAQNTPDNLAAFAFFLLKNCLASAEDAADDEFCRHLIEEALADPEKDDWVDFDEACKMLGVQLH